MSFITSALGWFSGLPGFVMVGLIFLVLGLVFRAGISTTIRSAIYVSAGILAITTVTQMMVNYVSPMASQLIENTALTNDVLDVGIAPAFSACITLPFFVFLYPIGLAVNFILLKLKWTKTVNVDFLDLFAILLPFVPVYILTGNAILVLLLAVVYYAITLKICDWTAPHYQKYFELDGISISHPHDALPRVLFIALDWVFDHIPGLNKIDVNFGDLSNKLGLFGNPTFLSFLIGTILGLVSKMGVASALGVGAAMACACLLFPKAVGIIMEGIRPISTKMRETMQRVFKLEDTYVGMDSAILAGYPESISVGAICLPIVLACYFLLPTVRIIPGGESLILATSAGLALPLMGGKKKGNAFRTVLAVVISTVINMHCSTYLAEMMTNFCLNSGIEVAEGTLVTSSVLGTPLSVIITLITRLFVH